MKNICILGDLMIDKYIQHDCKRISPEAPVPVLTNPKLKRCLGGAANVVKNLSEYNNFKLTVKGRVGNDIEADWLFEELNKIGITIHLERSELIKTIQKKRIIAGQQQLCRVDIESKASFSSIKFDNYDFDAVVISDYGKKTFGCPSNIILKCREFGIPTFVDPKCNDFSIYKGSYCLKPNKIEFENIVGKCDSLDSLIKKGSEFLNKYEIENLVITLGAEGIIYINKKKQYFFKKGKQIPVFNVTGAGDTVLASIVAGRLLGHNWEKCLDYSKYCAEYVISLSETGFLTADLIKDVMTKIF